MNYFQLRVQLINNTASSRGSHIITFFGPNTNSSVQSVSEHGGLLFSDSCAENPAFLRLICFVIVTSPEGSHQVPLCSVCVCVCVGVICALSWDVSSCMFISLPDKGGVYFCIQASDTKRVFQVSVVLCMCKEDKNKPLWRTETSIFLYEPAVLSLVRTRPLYQTPANRRSFGQAFRATHHYFLSSVTRGFQSSYQVL